MNLTTLQPKPTSTQHPMFLEKVDSMEVVAQETKLEYDSASLSNSPERAA